MVKNIFALPKELKSSLQKEFFEDILTANNVRLERIISEGHSSPDGFWYDQKVDEWVVVLKGNAEIVTIDSSGKETLWELHPGDAILLKAHQKHRVQKTSSDPKTVWLALHGNIDNDIIG